MGWPAEIPSEGQLSAVSPSCPSGPGDPPMTTECNYNYDVYIYIGIGWIDGLSD